MKLFFLLFTLLFTISSCSKSNERIEYSFSDEELDYCLLDNGTYSVSLNYDQIINKNLTLPSKHNGADVTEIAKHKGSSQACKIVNFLIPSNIKTIRSGAFSQLNVDNIRFENGVESLESYSFEGLKIKSLTLPESVKILSPLSFYCCSNLKSVNINKNNKFYCSVDGVVYTKNKETLVTFPFAKDNSFSIPKGTKEIGQYSFANTNIENVSFPSSVKTIGKNAFSDSKVKNVKLNNELVEIGEECFFSASKLTKINLPSSLATIGKRAFATWSSTIDLTLDKDNPYFQYENKTLYSSDYKTLYISNDVSIKDLVLKEETETISDYAFASCHHIEIISFNERLKEIGFGSFSSYKLEDITLPNSLKRIKSYAFSGCLSLANVTINREIEYIEAVAFNGLIGTYNYLGNTEDWNSVHLDEKWYFYSEFNANETKVNCLNGIVVYPKVK